MVNYKLSRRVEAWIRYSNSFFPNEDSVGSGLDKIEGNKRESVKVLLKINFYLTKIQEGYFVWLRLGSFSYII